MKHNRVRVVLYYLITTLAAIGFLCGLFDYSIAIKRLVLILLTIYASVEWGKFIKNSYFNIDS